MANLQCNPVDPDFLHFDQARLTGTGDNIPATNKLVIVYGTTPGGPYPNTNVPAPGTNSVGQSVDNIFCIAPPGTQIYYRVEEWDAGNNVIDSSAECTATLPNDGGANYWNAGPDCDSQFHGNFDIPGFETTRNAIYYTEPPMDDGSNCGATLDRRIEVGPTAAGPWTLASMGSFSGSNPGPALLSPSQAPGGGVATGIGFLEQNTTYFIRATLIVNGVDTGIPHICGPFTTPTYPTADCSIGLGATGPTTAVYTYFPINPNEQFNTQAGTNYDLSPNNTDRIRISIGTTSGGPYPLVFEEDADEAFGGGSIDITGLTACTQYFAVAEYLERDNGDNTDPSNYVAYSTSAECSFYTTCTDPDCNGATAITTTSATLNGTAHGLNPPGQVAFHWGTSSGVYPNVTTLQPGTGADPQAVSDNLAGLTPNTTYYYVLGYHKSDGGFFQQSTECQFTTLSAAAVATDPETNVTPTSADANGHGDFIPTDHFINICLGPTGGPYTTCGPNVPGTNVAGQPITNNFAGLTPNTQYCYVVHELDTDGTTILQTSPTEECFTTAALPTSVATDPATSVGTPNGCATLNGTSTDAPPGCTYQFRYGTTPGGPYGTTVPGVPAASTGATPEAFSAQVCNLSGPYYYVAEIICGANPPITGAEQTFNVPGPSVTSQPPTSIDTPNGCATFNAISNEVPAGCTYQFVYGTTPGGPYPNTVAGTPAVSTGADGEAFSAQVCGLTPGTTYYYVPQVLCGANPPINGAQTPVAMPGPATQTDPPTGVTPQCATFNGTSTNTAPGCTYSFSYGTTAGGPYDHTVPGNPPVSSGADPENFSAQVCTLDPNTTYYYIAVVQCGANPPIAGPEVSFATLDGVYWCGGLYNPADCILVDPGNGDDYFNCWPAPIRDGFPGEAQV